ncbi:putative ABC transporter ATP-binding protein YbhF [Rubripirellula obstinata]|uniref:Putative ABC transporter ATP-binding protein YbhF n=1 Tax=Rubripirellula obstinata TaxID=406547 RepID=A0A5B1CLI0_9BACT|nr:ABC transporter ATP-binding protein [Rubripirellula obstinata]KAA1262037.1 putative ABC transporter ATP-binding protein YbhF [Rubripirellula obstinata]
MIQATPTGVHESGDACIELRRLHRFFGKTKAVNDISFSVARGHVYGYIGPNGAGKTTSMRILATLDLPSYGDAYVDGFSVVNDPELVRGRLGFMPDSFGTYRDVNCQEYLDFFARAYGLIGRQRKQRLDWVLDFTGTQGMAEKPIRGLSKGMKQRLCLGRALIHDPAVMILDEPAAGLDPRARIQLRQMIRELADQGKTVLISSHILTELAEMCDSVGIIEQGKLLATGSVEEIERQQAHTRELVIRILANEDHSEVSVADVLRNRPEVDNLVVDGELIRFAFAGDVQDQAALVAMLVNQGFQVAEVTSRKKSLEDVFLHVTEGLVQ